MRSFVSPILISLMVTAAPSWAADAFDFSQWSQLSTPQPNSAAQHKFATGDFTGDGRDDVVIYTPSTGTLQLAVSSGAGFELQPASAPLTPKTGWTFYAGDFDSDGVMDLGAYQAAPNGFFVGTRTEGSNFAFAHWSNLLNLTGEWKFAVGKFAGDSRLDIAGLHTTTGNMYMGTNTGSGFTLAASNKISPANNLWMLGAGDYTADGLDDIFLHYTGNGTLWIGGNTGTTFGTVRWFTFRPTTNWSVMTGRFGNGVGPDVIAHYLVTGALLFGKNAGTSFTFNDPAWATMPTNTTWTTVSGDFNGDSLSDVLAFDNKTGSLKIGLNNGRGVPTEGYVWPLSAAPGEELKFFASGLAESVTIARHSTDAEGKVTHQPVASPTYQSTFQKTNLQPWANGAGWKESFSVTVQDCWKPGIYSARFRSVQGADSYATFVVKPSGQGAPKSKVLVIANTNTWNAYNPWGGRGKYTVPAAARTSFLRPNPPAAPVGETSEPHHLARAEIWVTGFLDQSNIAFDVYTDADFDAGIPNLLQYEKIIIDTHPEYWSAKMYGNLVGYLNNGGSLISLGGNSLYENAEFIADGTGLMFLNGIENGPRTAALLRNLGMPERSLLGVATEACAVDAAPYAVLKSSHPIFFGTNLVDGALIGAKGLSTRGGRYPSGAASGWETETSSGPGAMAQGCSGLSPMAPSSTLPGGLITLAKGTNSGTTGAEMIYYSHPGGGFVYAVGSLTFPGALAIDPTLQQMVRNAIFMRVPETGDDTMEPQAWGLDNNGNHGYTNNGNHFGQAAQCSGQNGNSDAAPGQNKEKKDHSDQGGNGEGADDRADDEA